jgi:hypothetical protein
MFVAVGCAYSRHPRCRMQNQPHLGGVQQNAESIACSTPPGCNIIEQSIPWVLQTHGYKHYTTPWCVNSIFLRMALRDGGWRLEKREENASGAQRRNYKMSSIEGIRECLKAPMGRTAITRGVNLGFACTNHSSPDKGGMKSIGLSLAFAMDGSNQCQSKN